MRESRTAPSPASAAMPACCVNGGTHDSDVLVSVPSTSIVAGALTANPNRHPLMLNDLLKV